MLDELETVYPNQEKYLDFDPKADWQTSKNLFYECLRCGCVSKKDSFERICCACGNIVLDIGTRLPVIEDEKLVRVFTYVDEK